MEETMSNEWKADFDHAAIRVRDIAKVIKFFTEEMGLTLDRLVGPENEPDMAFLGKLQLVRSEGHERRRDVHHLGLKVNNYESAIKELQRDGYKFTKPNFFIGPEEIVIELLKE